MRLDKEAVTKEERVSGEVRKQPSTSRTTAAPREDRRRSFPRAAESVGCVAAPQWRTEALVDRAPPRWADGSADTNCLETNAVLAMLIVLLSARENRHRVPCSKRVRRGDRVVAVLKGWISFRHRPRGARP